MSKRKKKKKKKNVGNDLQNIIIIILQNIFNILHRVLCRVIEQNGITNNVDPDQTAPHTQTT